MHELVVPEPGQGPANPHEYKEEKEGFGEYHDGSHQSPQPVCIDSGEMITAEIHGRDDSGGNKHVDIFRKQEESQLHGAVFRMVTPNQFRFTFGQIERRAIRFRKRTDKKYEESEWLYKDVP